MFKYLLAALLLVTQAHANTTRTVQADNLEGVEASQNIIKNPGAEIGGTLFHVESGGTFTTTTTAANVARGDRAFSWDSVSASQTARGTLVTIPSGLYGRNGEVSGLFQCPSGTCTHELQIYDGTTATTVATLVSGTLFNKTTGNFIFPQSGSLTYQLKSINANEPNVNFDNLYLGEARNIGSVAQARFVGALTFPETASCSWTITQTTYAADFSAQASCPAATVTGYITSPSKTPQATYNNAPPGTYRVMFQGHVEPSSSSVNAKCRIIDDLSNVLVENALAVTGHTMMPLEGSWTYPNNGNRTWKVQCLSASSSVTIHADTTNYGGASFQVFQYPASSEQSYRPDVIPGSWSGYHDNTCSWARTNAAYGDPTADASCALVERVNQNFGSVTTSGGVLPAITFTPKRIGRYLVFAKAKMAGSSLAATIDARLWDGTTTIAESQFQESVATDIFEMTMQGIYNVTTTAAVTFSIQTRATAGSATIAAGSTNLSALEWTVIQIDQGVNAPVLVGSVTSNSSGALRAEHAQVTVSNSAAAIVTQSGSWLSVANGGGVGLTTGTMSGFSAAPSCTCTVIGATTTSATHCIFTAEPTSTSLLISRNRAGAAENGDVNIHCIGPR